jgi:hypothetical protein
LECSAERRNLTLVACKFVRPINHCIVALMRVPLAIVGVSSIHHTKLSAFVS